MDGINIGNMNDQQAICTIADKINAMTDVINQLQEKIEQMEEDKPIDEKPKVGRPKKVISSVNS